MNMISSEFMAKVEGVSKLYSIGLMFSQPGSDIFKTELLMTVIKVTWSIGPFAFTSYSVAVISNNRK